MWLILLVYLHLTVAFKLYFLALARMKNHSVWSQLEDWPGWISRWWHSLEKHTLSFVKKCIII